MNTNREVEMRNKIIVLADEIFQKAISRYGIKSQTLSHKFDLRGVSAGQAIDSYRLRWNIAVAMENETSFLSATVPHEIAHLVCHSMGHIRGHGPTWRNICVYLGGTGETYHNYQVTPSRTAGTAKAHCSCRTMEISIRRRNRMLRGTKYICSRCRTNLILGE